MSQRKERVLKTEAPLAGRRLMERYVLFTAKSPQWHLVVEHVGVHRRSAVAEQGPGNSGKCKKTEKRGSTHGKSFRLEDFSCWPAARVSETASILTHRMREHAFGVPSQPPPIADTVRCHDRTPKVRVRSRFSHVEEAAQHGLGEGVSA